MLQDKKVLFYEILGAIFIILLGSLLHFAFELSGKLAFVGAFSAVNESVWEHMKLAFWPSFFWLLVEYFPLKNLSKNFFTAKTAGTYLMVILIPMLFYSYTSITGKSIFAIDITIFIVAVIFGQILSYSLLTKKQILIQMSIIALAFLIALAIAFTVFTYYPPNLQIFQDSLTKGYGIIE